MSALWVAVPLKQMDRGKERLGSSLSATQRRELVEAMARDVVAALRAAPIEAAHILLVSEDAAVKNLAQELGIGLFVPAATIDDPLNAALNEVARHVLQQGAGELLILHADLPRARGEDIAGLIAFHRAAGAGNAGATLISDTAGEGTNCLICSPPDAVQFQFGIQSRRRHRELYAAAGIACFEYRCAALEKDIDHPQDVITLVHDAQITQNGIGAATLAALRGVFGHMSGSTG